MGSQYGVHVEAHANLQRNKVLFYATMTGMGLYELYRNDEYSLPNDSSYIPPNVSNGQLQRNNMTFE